MNVEQMSIIRPGNPFLDDPYHMGTRVGTNVMVMFDKFPTDRCEYLIIVDTTTGERLKVSFK